MKIDFFFIRNGLKQTHIEPPGADEPEWASPNRFKVPRNKKRL